MSLGASLQLLGRLKLTSGVGVGRVGSSEEQEIHW